jgi:hypothetical protein
MYKIFFLTGKSNALYKKNGQSVSERMVGKQYVPKYSSGV